MKARAAKIPLHQLLIIRRIYAYLYLIKYLHALNQNNEFGYLSEVRARDGRTIRYQADSAGRLLSVQGLEGEVHTYEYETRNNSHLLRKKTDAAEGITTYTYAANRLKTITNPSGKTFTFSYDEMGRRKALSYPNSVAVSYQYDEAGRLTEITNKAVANGILRSLTSPAGKVSSLAYDKLKGTGYPSSVTAANQYDKAGSVTEPANKIAVMTESVISSNAYTYSANNNVITKTDLNGTTTYQYDATSQLTQAMHPALTEAFTYDDSGNRITETRDGSVVNYTHTAGNRIETRDGVIYTHDNNGNIISKAGITGTTTYEYDYANRLNKVTMPDGTISEYKYDALWRRIEKKITPSPLVGEGGGEGIIAARYLYDGLNMLAEYEDNNVLKTKYTHNRAIDDPLAMERNGQSYYYHKDALGSITTITDDQVNLVQWYQYDSFGKITDRMNPLFKQPYVFTGREYDEETGLYNYRFRYYDPEMGRFISEDPIGFKKGSINLFAYVSNNPVNKIDPLGLLIYSPTWKGYLGVLLGGVGLALAPEFLVAGGVFVVVGAGLTIWDAIEGGESIKELDNKLNPTRDEMKDLQKELDKLDKSERGKNKQCSS